MDWLSNAIILFKADKPRHFTDFNHCDECAEHNETLRNNDVNNISLDELGRPGWDPICFCTDEGKRYYTPAFVRLSLQASLTNIADDFYFEQFLFHLNADGPQNSYYKSCSPIQRQFLASFIEFMINHYAQRIEQCLCTDSALSAYKIWSITET